MLPLNVEPDSEDKIHTPWRQGLLGQFYDSFMTGKWCASAYALIATQEEPERDLELGLPQASNKKLSMSEVAIEFRGLLFSDENWPNIIKVSGLTLFNMATNFGTPYIFSQTIGSLTRNEPLIIGGIPCSQEAVLTVCLVAYVLSVSQLIPNTRDKILSSVGNSTMQKLCMRVIEHLLNKPLNYHRSIEDGDKDVLLQKSGDIASIIPPLLTHIVPTFFEILLATFLLSTQFGSEIGLGLMGVVSFLILHARLTIPNVIQARKEVQEIAPKTWNNLTSGLRLPGYKTIYDFGQLTFTLQEIDESTKASAKAFINAETVALDINRSQLMITYGGMLLATLYMGHKILGNPTSDLVQNYSVLLMYLTQLCRLLPALRQSINNIFAAYPTLELLFNELAQKDSAMDKYPDVPLNMNGILDKKMPLVEFQDVTLQYDGKEQALFNHFSFKIYAGQTVALVSKSGAGKSSIFDLLYRYYDPSSGEIFINGQNIAEVGLTSLRENISLIRQQAPLIGNTIRSIIQYGAKSSLEVNDDTLWELASKVGLTDFIQAFSPNAFIETETGICRLSPQQLLRLPLDTQKQYFKEGLSIDAGINGNKLSGGEQQKVAILRGMIKDSAIRLLDESTSALDAPAARAVLTGIAEIAEEHGSTQIMITHKLQETKHADLIIVLDKDTGFIAAQGTHEELLDDERGCALYKTLWAEQNSSTEYYSSKSNSPTLFSQSSPVSSVADIKDPTPK